MSRVVSATTLEQLLTMQSGLPADLRRSTTPVYAETRDWVRTILEAGLTGTPTQFSYGSASASSSPPRSSRLSASRSRRTPAGSSSGRSASADPCRGRSPPPVTLRRFGGLQLDARALLALGQLHLDGGEAGGRRLLSSGWVERAIGDQQFAPDPAGYGFGYLWWVSELDGHRLRGVRRGPAAPGDRARPRMVVVALGDLEPDFGLDGQALQDPLTGAVLAGVVTSTRSHRRRELAGPSERQVREAEPVPVATEPPRAVLVGAHPHAIGVGVVGVRDEPLLLVGEEAGLERLPLRGRAPSRSTAAGTQRPRPCRRARPGPGAPARRPTRASRSTGPVGSQKPSPSSSRPPGSTRSRRALSASTPSPNACVDPTQRTRSAGSVYDDPSWSRKRTRSSSARARAAALARSRRGGRCRCPWPARPVPRRRPAGAARPSRSRRRRPLRALLRQDGQPAGPHARRRAGR